MPSGRRVTSDIFIGREQEQQRFKAILSSTSPSRIISIYSDGKGGFGKTQLVLQMQHLCRNELASHVFCGDKLIDFYDTNSRTRVGVLFQIVKILQQAYSEGIQVFSEFQTLASHYQQKELEAAKREHLRTQLEDAFIREYQEVAATLHETGKVIVLFFDTYEVIQNETILDNQKTVQNTEFSRWLETQLFSKLKNNTCIVVSGRYPLKAIRPDDPINLAQFSFEETILFWKQCFATESHQEVTDEELYENVGNKEWLPIFHRLADGRPILLALFVDWLNYERNPLTPHQLLEQLAIKIPFPETQISPEQQKAFERILVERVARLDKPEDLAVTYLAVAYRRMTPEMLQYLTDKDLQQCREILTKRLLKLSFVKDKGNHIVILHDEMRRLILEYFWKDQDPLRELRGQIASKLVKYYEQILMPGLEADRETYTTELLEYALWADPTDGLNRLKLEFDVALDDGNHDYFELLLREFEKYRRENPHDLPFPDEHELELRQIQSWNEVKGEYKQAKEKAAEIHAQYMHNEKWEKNVLRGRFLMEQAKAEFYQEHFKECILLFAQAQEIFYRWGENILMVLAQNWIGYAYNRQGQFPEAEQELGHARDEILHIYFESGRQFPQLLHQRREVFQLIATILGNLAVVYNHTGSFARALRNAEIALEVAREQERNRVEEARLRNTVGSIFALTGLTIDARHHFDRAKELLQDGPKRDIQGRVKLESGFLESRTGQLTALLEYYRAEEFMNITEVIHTSDLLKKFDYAEQALNDAVNLLAENPPVKKELGDAYYHLGDLYLIRLDWQKAEEAFTQSLTWARGSQFRYREISTLASLVSLYYLWNRSAGISDEQKKQNLKLMEERQDSLDGLSSEYSTEYPNLYGKYQLTLGNLAFDSALELLPNIFSQRRVEESLQSLSAAFDYYKRATEYMKQFKSSEHYYLTLRVISNRLGMLLKKFQEKGFLYDHKVEVRKILDEKLANKLPEDFKPFYAAILLRIAPQEKSVEIDQLITSIADAEEQEEFQRALLLNDCLIETYKMIVDSANKENTSQFTNVIEKILAQSRYYRIEGDEYQAEECLAEVRKDYLPKIMDSALRQGFEGYLLSHEGTLKYRRGEYGKLLEYYVQDLRETACQKFDIQYKNARADARALLAESEKKLTQSILEVSSQLQACKEQNERMRLQKWKTRFEAYRAENHFRMGELFTLSGEFEGDKGALEHLRKAIDYFQQTENLYRYHYAMQSYLEALYFSGNYENSFRYKERLPFENLLEEQTKQTHPSIPKMEKVHPSIMGRLRIIQADVLFSSYFTQPASPSRQKYSLRKKFEHADIPLLRDMVQKYVEACAFMEQQGKPHFEVAARVLQRRIELIGEPTILQEVIDALPPAWAKHSTLQEEEYRFVRASLVDFAKIRRMLLIENKKEEYEKGK